MPRWQLSDQTTPIACAPGRGCACSMIVMPGDLEKGDLAAQQGRQDAPVGGEIMICGHIALGPHARCLRRPHRPPHQPAPKRDGDQHQGNDGFRGLGSLSDASRPSIDISGLVFPAGPYFHRPPRRQIGAHKGSYKGSGRCSPNWRQTPPSAKTVAVLIRPSPAT